MANKPSIVDGASNSLQRGKACLRCRKRKMRCSGDRPSCTQCQRAKKGENCEYDDGKGKTRTQILRETIMRLEQRVRELEDPDYIPPAVSLYDPHIRGFSESPPSSSYDSAGDASFSAGHSPFASESAQSPEESWTHSVSASPPLFGPDLFYHEPLPQHQPPLDLALMLLDIFAPHRHQCGLDVHIGQLKESLSRPMAEQRHPVLMNAIYLWACFISRPEPLSHHEDHYLNQALDALRDALRDVGSTIDVVQASCLLSTYFLANGRLLEGSYHASAAAALAVQCGLHTKVTPEASAWLSDPSNDLKPYKVDLRQGERILAFWQVYNLDRCWSVALRKPAVIPDGPHTWNSINCPWPLDVAEYQAGSISSGVNFQTIKSFLEGDVANDGYSTPALRAKASALFERADTLSASWDSTVKPSDSFHQEIQSLELLIGAFVATLPSLHQLDSSSEDRPVLIAVHTLAHTAMIHLYQRFASDDPTCYEKCSRAARACSAIITHMTDADFAFLDPILGPCWTSAAETLMRELAAITSSWPPINGVEVRNELGSILYAMTSLGSRFPLLAVSAEKIQKRLAEL